MDLRQLYNTPPCKLPFAQQFQPDLVHAQVPRKAKITLPLSTLTSSEKTSSLSARADNNLAFTTGSLVTALANTSWLQCFKAHCNYLMANPKCLERLGMVSPVLHETFYLMPVSSGSPIPGCPDPSCPP